MFHCCFQATITAEGDSKFVHQQDADIPSTLIRELTDDETMTMVSNKGLMSNEYYYECSSMSCDSMSNEYHSMSCDSALLYKSSVAQNMSHLNSVICCETTELMKVRGVSNTYC